MEAIFCKCGREIKLSHTYEQLQAENADLHKEYQDLAAINLEQAGEIKRLKGE